MPHCNVPQLTSMAENEAGLNGLPLSLTYPCAASSAEILCEQRVPKSKGRGVTAPPQQP